MTIVHFTKALNCTSGISEFVSEVSCEMRHAGHTAIIHLKWHLEHSVPDNVVVKIDPWFRAVPKDIDIAHVHGAWTLHSIFAMIWCLVHRVPFVFSPHGSFMPRVFEHGTLKKRIVFYLILKPLVKKAKFIHVTADREGEECVKLGLCKTYVVAPLGVHLPEMGISSHPLTVLFLGRLSEEKGLLNLLDAWHQLQTEQSSTVPLFSTPVFSSRPRLVIAGPDWNGYKKVLDAKIAADHITGVEFTGSVQGAEKDRLYREADIFVLPSPMENFSMVVLEALAYGIPVIATKGTPWRELESEKCGCWIDQGVAPLREALAQLLNAQPSTLNALGANGRALAARRYQWPAIARCLTDCYNNCAPVFLQRNFHS